MAMKVSLLVVLLAVTVYSAPIEDDEDIDYADYSESEDFGDNEWYQDERMPTPYDADQPSLSSDANSTASNAYATSVTTAITSALTSTVSTTVTPTYTLQAPNSTPVTPIPAPPATRTASPTVVRRTTRLTASASTPNPALGRPTNVSVSTIRSSSVLVTSSSVLVRSSSTIVTPTSAFITPTSALLTPTSALVTSTNVSITPTPTTVTPTTTTVTTTSIPTGRIDIGQFIDSFCREDSAIKEYLGDQKTDDSLEEDDSYSVREDDESDQLMEEEPAEEESKTDIMETIADAESEPEENVI